jgi:hypothetical protein
MTDPTRWALPQPDPYQGATRCPACAGAKVTGEQYIFDQSSPRHLLVDVFCPVCGGCGRAEHGQCGPRDHVSSDSDDDWDEDDDDGEERGMCPSCHGLRYWVVLGFSSDVAHHLRVPCGCAQDLLVQVGGAS